MQRGVNCWENKFYGFSCISISPNTAIYLQMFQNQWHFGKKKDSFEAFEQREVAQYSYQENMQQKIFLIRIKPQLASIPIGIYSAMFVLYWREFRKTEIWLICFISQQVEENGSIFSFVGISYFLEKVELSGQLWGSKYHYSLYIAFVVCTTIWKTTKLIWACEFIRKNHNDLGETEKNLNWFWVGVSTIPNKIKDAKNKYDTITNKLNNGNYANKSDYLNNPFQLSNANGAIQKL